MGGSARAEIAALSAAFVRAAPSPEIAATGFEAFFRTLTAGESATERQIGVLGRLGLDAEELAERMQVDAKGAILDVVDAMAELPDARRIPALNDLFGQESARTIAPLINNLDILRESFALVAEEGNYTGSMTREAEDRADTTANTLQLTRNTIAAIATTVGTELLPGFNRVLETVNEVLRSIYGCGEAIESFKESLDAIEMPAWIGEGNGLRIGYEGTRLQRWMGGGGEPGRALGGPVRAGIAQGLSRSAHRAWHEYRSIPARRGADAGHARRPRGSLAASAPVDDRHEGHPDRARRRPARAHGGG
jgi:hypothetical protein